MFPWQESTREGTFNVVHHSLFLDYRAPGAAPSMFKVLSSRWLFKCPRAWNSVTCMCSSTLVLIFRCFAVVCTDWQYHRKRFTRSCMACHAQDLKKEACDENGKSHQTNDSIPSFWKIIYSLKKILSVLASISIHSGHSPDTSCCILHPCGHVMG